MMDISNLNPVRICVTGHRPNHLKSNSYLWDHSENIRLRKHIKLTINNLIKDHLEKDYIFISGMALGVDLFFFDCMYDLQQSKYVKGDVVLWAAIPFDQQTKKWNTIDQMRHTEMYLKANKIIKVDELPEYSMGGHKVGEYAAMKMHNRNRFMIDNSDIVFAVWNGRNSGGTWNAVSYAKRIGKPILRLDPFTYEVSEM